MASPYSTGGGGAHLEARVAASILAAILCESSIRGLPGQYPTLVRTQRASFDDPLDDVIVDGRHHDGAATQLHLQVKSKLTFTEGDTEWVDCLQRAWSTFSRAGFNPGLHRVGVGIGTYNAKADQHYQSVLNWAEYSVDGKHFFERIAQKDYSHQDKQSFVATVKAVLVAYTGRALTEDELWHFLKSLVIVHYDFQSASESRDEANVIERLKGLLIPDLRDHAARIWEHLVAKAGELIPAGGGATRATLVEQLTRDGFTVGAAGSFWKDIAALDRESRRALGDIKSHIQGLKIHRAGAYESAREALSTARFIQVDGEPGSGKSALLKEIAEECARNGPVLVLKDSRIHPRGWAAHAHVLGISDDVVALLREFACAGEPTLFIDGIDKIVDPAVQLTVNDVLKSIAGNTSLSAWRILVTIREQNLKHLETWLDADAINRLPLRTIRVEPLKDDEVDFVANRFPQLRPLIKHSSGPDIILKRPFFLNALLALADIDGGRLPTTEVELLRLWWEMGGSDRKDFPLAQSRRNLLLDAAESVAREPNAPIAIRNFAPEELEELKSAGVFRDKELGHSVVFTHDIYEEWALCEFLIGQQAHFAELLSQLGEPDALIRPTQLLGSYVLETSPSSDAWKALLQATGDAKLRPVWQRAILTSCLQSTRTTYLLQKLTIQLLENDAECLRKLLRAMETVEVLPNPIFLDEQRTPNIRPDERATYAHLLAVPKPITWLRFLDWLMPQLADQSQSLIPDLLPVYETWQRAFAGTGIRHGREIGGTAHEWLKEIEAACHPTRWEDRREPFSGARLEEDTEKRIRSLFLSSAGDVPNLLSEYLRNRILDREHLHMFREEILKNCGALVVHLPSDLVDFVLAAYLEDPDERRDPFGNHSDHFFRDLGVADDHAFYPASPIQLPFLQLLRIHEDQGLRLIKGVCNHSIRIWLKGKRRGWHYAGPMTPLPITLTFPWGEQTFWGDGQVYQWFRGVGGNSLVESALMAQEQWALERVDAGVPFGEVFRKVIEGNESVAALGVGVSLCLAHPKSSLESAYPLVTCNYLWEWDIARYGQDLMPSNEIGDWHRYRIQLMATRDLNRKPHRKLEIRSLVPYFIVSGDEALVERFTKDVRSFPERLPISYEEEKNEPAHLEAWRDKMSLFSEQADPQYMKMAPTEDGKDIRFWNEPPSLQKEIYKAQQDEHVQLNAYLGVALWAAKSLEKGSIDESQTLEEALTKVRSWDAPDVFNTDPDAFDERQRAAAVVGAAYVAAKNCALETWTDELAMWCRDVFQRAATNAGNAAGYLIRDSALTMHPGVFAAHGYSALLQRNYEGSRCMTALLNLAVDTLQGVQITVLESAKYYAAAQPRFYWVLLDLVLQQCVVRRDEIPDYYSMVSDKEELKRKAALLKHARKCLQSGDAPKLPPIPMPWVKGYEARSRSESNTTKGYAKNDTIFLWNLAEKALEHVCFEVVLADTVRRARFLRFVGELLEYTFQELVPPFAASRHEHSRNTPYEWVLGFSHWCGKLCAEVTHEEANEVVLSRIWKQDQDSALQMMQSLMPTFLIAAFLQRKDISDKHVTLWSEMVSWLFENPEWVKNGGGDHLDREFTSCAFTTLFCVSSGFSPLVCGIDSGWPHLHKFLPIIKRAICEFGRNTMLYFAAITFLKRGGIDLLPEPALAWLHGVVSSRKGDRKFWRENGPGTVELLKLVISQKGDLLSAEHNKMIKLIADILTDDGVRGAGFLQQELLRKV